MTKIKSLINSKSASSKFNSNKNYSSFWMNDNDFYSGSNSRWAGLAGNAKSSSNTVKVIKLQSYRKAIANFVKILTKQDIPVFFAGDTSYTDFKKVVLSTDIKDASFDVSVGLALHEASHLILTDREYLPKMMNAQYFRYAGSSDWKNLLNWIEDRRIDQYIFRTSPGYKAYYHKMYDHFWNDDAITAALKSSAFRDPKQMESWMFRIVNSLNPAADVNALPRLGEVLQLIDTKSIKRLASTAEAGQVAAEVMDVILSFMAEPEAEEPKPEDKVNQGPGSESTNDEQDEEPQDNDDNEFGEDERQGGQDLQDQESSQGNDSEDAESQEEDSQSNSGTAAESQEEEKPADLTPSEMFKLNQAMKAQQKFLDGETDKTRANNALTNQLKASSGSNAEIQQVGDGRIANTAIVYDLTKDNVIMETVELHRQLHDTSDKDARNAMKSRINALEERLPKNFANHSISFQIHEGPDGHERNEATAVHRGLEMGALLGRKMQVRSESRELVTNRMNTGHIDNKRLAQAGFGIENIFKQVTVDRYKKANLHISLDISGSMGGRKWYNTVMMTTAICKAVSMIQNLEVQVSLRMTDSDHPVITTIYDSRKNKMRQLTSALLLAGTNHMTPEGLCFEAQIRKNLLVPGNKEMDSYFLNLSDGAPGGCGHYSGTAAVTHTKKQMEKLKEMNINILGFFMSESSSEHSLNDFRTMYGAKNSKQVKPSDAMEIARAMNELFMTKN